MRQTSIDAYNEIKRNGLLSKKRLEVYDIIFNNGPLTDHEVAARMESALNLANGANSGARIWELCQMGAVERVGTKVAETGMTVTLWDVTDRLPQPLAKTLTTKQKLAKAMSFIESKGLSREFEESSQND